MALVGEGRSAAPWGGRGARVHTCLEGAGCALQRRQRVPLHAHPPRDLGCAQALPGALAGPHLCGSGDRRQEVGEGRHGAQHKESWAMAGRVDVAQTRVSAALAAPAAPAAFSQAVGSTPSTRTQCPRGGAPGRGAAGQLSGGVKKTSGLTPHHDPQGINIHSLAQPPLRQHLGRLGAGTGAGGASA